MCKRQWMKHIPGKSVFDVYHLYLSNVYDNIYDNVNDNVYDNVGRVQRSISGASSIGVYTSTHRAGRWTEGEDFLLTAESEDEVDEKSGLKLLMIIRCGETINA